MNPTNTLYNPTTGITATPIAGVTTTQQQGAYDMGFRPNPLSVNTPISSGNLGMIQPLVIPPTQITGLGAAGLTGAAQVSIENYQQVLDQQQIEKQQEADQSKSDLKGIMGQYLGVQASRPQVEADLRVDEKSKKADDAFNALQGSQRAQQVELKALDSANLTDSGRAAASRDINRKYAFEQADYAIALDVAERSYTRAQNTADKKIQLQLEPLKTLLDFQKMFYDENKADLTKAEDRQFQSLLTTSNRKYQTEENNLKMVSAIQLEAAKNGAPVSVQQAIGKAKDQTGAIIAAGGYIAPPSTGGSNVLSISDAEKLGVPYGTTRDQAMALGMVPGVKTEANSLKTTALTSASQLLEKFNSNKTIFGANKSPVGLSSMFGTIPGTSARDFSVQFDNLKSLLSLDNVKYLKGQGQVSDAERRLLEQASAKLNRAQSPGEFEASLKEVITSLSGPATGSSEEDTLRAAGYTDAQIKEIKAAK